MTTDQIAAKIVKEHAQFKNELRHAVIRARRIGDLLIEAKLNIPHGEWMKWVDDKAKLSLTWASTYMAIASGWERVEKYGVDISVRQAEDVARGRPIKEHGGHNDAAIGRLLSILEVKVADLVLDYPEISDIVDEIHKWRERLAAIGQLKKARGAKSTRPDITEKVMNAYVAGYRPIQIFKELQKQGAHVSYAWVQKVCSGKIGKRVASSVITALLLLSSVAWADGPSIVGTPIEVSADNAIRVKVGQPPWVNLAIKDAPSEATQTWSGPIGEGKVAFYTKDGVGLATSLSGAFPFRCILQTPKEGLDDVAIVEVTVIVEGSTPGPTPTPIPTPTPVEDFATKLTSAVRAKAADSEQLGRVANTYAIIADQIKSGLLTEPVQVTGMTNLMTGLFSSWASIKADVIDPHLATLTLTKAADYEPVWRQIAAAVKAGLTDIPPPVPVPIPTAEFRILILEETADRSKIPTSQLNVITSAPLRTWMDEIGAKWRVWDQNVDAANEDAAWQAALKLTHGPLPWIHVANGKTGFSGPLPATVEETKTLIGKYKP